MVSEIHNSCTLYDLVFFPMFLELLWKVMERASVESSDLLSENDLLFFYLLDLGETLLLVSTQKSNILSV